MEKLLSNYDKMVINSEREQTALEMLADGEPMEKIIRYTKLTEAEIKKIAKRPTKKAA